MLPVKGPECTGCKHAFLYVANSSALAVACRKDVDCKEFEPREKLEREYVGLAYGDSRYFIGPIIG